MSSLDVRRERRKYQEAIEQRADAAGSLQQRLETLPSARESPPRIPPEHAAHWNRQFTRERARLVKLWLLYDDAEAEVRERASEVADERERSRELHGVATTHEEEVAWLEAELGEKDASIQTLRRRMADQQAALEDAQGTAREVHGALVAHEEEVLRLRRELARSDGEASGLQDLTARMENDIQRLRHQVVARQDEARYARSVLQAARAEHQETGQAEGQLGVGPLFDRWDRLSESSTAPESYREGPYTLYAVDVVVAGGGSRTFYFFARNEPERGRPARLPSGYEVDHNPKNGLPYLRKAT